MSIWEFYHTYRDDIVPLFTLVGAIGLAGAALWQAYTARRRHYAQTEADRQRRITEGFSKAVEQLGNDKIEARLGGIYTLERISRESPADYWTIIETLTAFIRHHARLKEPDTSCAETIPRLYEQDRAKEEPEPPTDIAAIISVIVRRSKSSQRKEQHQGWRLDLRETDLRGAFFTGANLIGANFMGAHLEHARLAEANLQYANLQGAYLESANFMEANLERALLDKSHLQFATLTRANLRFASLCDAHLRHVQVIETHFEGAFFYDTKFEDVDFARAHLKGAEGLHTCSGDARTRLPQGVARPESWPPPAKQ
jgi:hypothetical protein